MSITTARTPAPFRETKNAGDSVPETQELKQLSTELKSTFEKFKERDQQREAEIKKFGEATAETTAALKKLNDRLDEIEPKAQRARTAAGESKDAETPEVKAMLAAESKYMRYGEKNLTEAERKSLATDDNTDGGYLVSPQRANKIIEKLIEFSPIRELATVETISKGNTYEVPAEGSQDFDAGWVGERETRAETNAGKLRMEKIPTHEIYAAPRATRAMLDDADFGVEDWAQRRVSKRFGVKEGTAFISGDADGKPEGLLTNADVTEVVTGSAAALTADGLISLVYDLPEFYARNATFVMKRATVAAVRKLKDSQNRYLWEPGLNGGGAPMLLGYPYREAIDMPAVGANNYPVLFGDFRAAYTIVDRKGITLIRDEVTAKPFVILYYTKRVGGQVVLAEAMRKHKCST